MNIFKFKHAIVVHRFVRERWQIWIFEWLFHIAKHVSLLSLELGVRPIKELIDDKLLLIQDLRQIHHENLIVLWTINFREDLLKDEFHRFYVVL